MLLAIFRDLVSKNRLFLFLTSLAFALYYHLVGAKFSTSFQVLLISTAIVTALSTFQLLYSYFFDGQGPGLLPASFVSQSF